MNNRTTTFMTVIVSLVIAYFFIHTLFFGQARTVRNDVIQGVLIGGGLAFVTAQIYARIIAARVNGWITIYGLGLPGKSMFFRAACAQSFPGPVNVPQEAMYWTTSGDGAGRTLDGHNNYIIHFPPGQLPPNDAFWSLTMGDAQNRFVANPLNRYSVGDRSGLTPNVDGSVDIYMQNAPPAGHASNWLPSPAGKFILWLRVYMPGAPILERKWMVPPVVEVK